MFFGGVGESLTITDCEARLNELLSRAQRAMLHGDPDPRLMMLTDDTFARSFVRQFHGGCTDAH
jgi:hypothetical protein